LYYSNTPVPAGDNTLELSGISEEDCQINRYGYFEATITIVGKAEDLWGWMPESTSQFLDWKGDVVSKDTPLLIQDDSNMHKQTPHF
jgi:hypothetical protein